MTKRIYSALGIAAFMLVTAAALRYAQGLDVISAEAARRANHTVIGLVLALFGNLMPKDIARSRMSACASWRLQSPLRVGGWLFTLAGLVYAGFSALAPIAIADTVAISVVAAATLITVG